MIVNKAEISETIEDIQRKWGYECYKYGDVGVEIPKIYNTNCGEIKCLIEGRQYRFCEEDECPIWIKMHKFPENPEELEWRLNILAPYLKKKGLNIQINKENIIIINENYQKKN